MRIKVKYLLNDTVDVARFLCDEVRIQSFYDGRGLIVFANGRDRYGPIDSLQIAHLELVERRPSSDNDDAWLLLS